MHGVCEEGSPKPVADAASARSSSVGWGWRCDESVHVGFDRGVHGRIDGGSTHRESSPKLASLALAASSRCSSAGCGWKCGWKCASGCEWGVNERGIAWFSAGANRIQWLTLRARAEAASARRHRRRSRRARAGTAPWHSRSRRAHARSSRRARAWAHSGQPNRALTTALRRGIRRGAHRTWRGGKSAAKLTTRLYHQHTRH